MNVPFLTDIDSRAAVKGSRDPLGQVSIWTRFGRHVVGNLTTVSSEVRDFTALLIGLWLTERVVQENNDTSDLDVFIRWEQLAGYARAKQSATKSFRGVDKVRFNLSEGSRVTICADRGFQILGNQKIYGIWGLYTVAARSSGLVVGDPPRLTPVARAFVEERYIAQLSHAGFRDAGLLRKVLGEQRITIQTEGDGQQAQLLQAVGQILRADKIAAAEREFYDRHLVCGGPGDETRGKQRQLAALFEKTFVEEDYEFSPKRLAKLENAAKDRELPDSLALRLERIRRCEALMAPAYGLFGFLQTQDGNTLEVVAKKIESTWGDAPAALELAHTEALLPELGAGGDVGSGERWLELAQHLAACRYPDVVRSLVGINASVMKLRGSAAPWIELRGGKLHVRFRDDISRLASRKELRDAWRFPYFLNSLRAVTEQIRGRA